MFPRYDDWNLGYMDGRNDGANRHVRRLLYVTPVVAVMAYSALLRG